MRELILLRHAHAEPASAGQIDIDRPLSPEGRAEAEAAGQWLADKGLVPGRVLCSPSRRTRETLEVALAKLDAAQRDAVELRLEDSIYEATSGTLAGLADSHRDVDRLLVVGHNPGLEHLAALMHSGQSGDYRGMPPGGIVVLSLPVEAAIEPGVATLSAFWWP